MPSTEDKYLEKDELLLANLPQTLADCPNDIRSMRRLLEKLVAAKERFAGGRQRLDAASALRGAERAVQVRIRIATSK